MAVRIMIQKSTRLCFNNEDDQKRWKYSLKFLAKQFFTLLFNEV